MLLFNQQTIRKVGEKMENKELDSKKEITKIIKEKLDANRKISLDLAHTEINKIIAENIKNNK